MEQFKKKLIGIAGGITVRAIVFFGIAILLALFGFLLNNRDEYPPFHPLNDGYACMDVVYVMGPFVEETDGERATKEFFIAEATDQMWYVVSTKPNTQLPIYGEDISDADIENLTAQTVYGNSKQIPDELVSYLVEYFSETDFGITNANYSDFFGTHYLDTTVSAPRGWDTFYYLAIIMALVSIVLFFAGNKQRKKAKMQIDELEANGQLNDIYDDFASVDSIYASKLNLAVSHHYLLDFSVSGVGVNIIRLSDIDRVFLCKMIAGQPTTANFIALENEDTRYCVANCPKRTKQFDQILERLKNDIEKEKKAQ